MSEDRQQEEELPQSKIESIGVTRRAFLGGVAAMFAGAILPKNLPESSNVMRIEGIELEPFANRVEQLMVRVKDTEILNFLEESKKAHKNLEELAQRSEVDTIRKLVRQTFSNQDIDIDNQIFFLRDQRILHQAIEKMEQLNWESGESQSLQQQAEEILETSPSPITMREYRAPASERRCTPRMIVENYSRMGTRKSGGEISIVGGTQTATPQAVTRLNQVEEVVSKNLSTLPLGDVQISVVIWNAWSERESIRGSQFYRPWISPKPGIEYHFQANPLPNHAERELLFILHEAAHAMDIEVNPTLIEFLSSEDIAQLTLLREQAALSLFSIDIETLFGTKQLRGERVWALEGLIGNQISEAVDWRSWFLTKTQDAALNPEEFNLLVRMYPETSWFWLEPLLRPWYGKLQVELNDAIISKNDRTPLSSWQEFLNRNQDVLNTLAEHDPVFAFGLNLLKTRIDSVDSQLIRGKPASHWQVQFSKAIEAVLAEDLLRMGNSRSVFASVLYAQLLEEFQLEYRGAEREGFADGIAFLLFLQSQRGHDPDELNSIYWGYFEKLCSVMPTPKIHTL